MGHRIVFAVEHYPMIYSLKKTYIEKVVKDLVQNNYSGLIGALFVIFIVITFKIRTLMRITISNNMVSSQIVFWIVALLLLSVINFHFHSISFLLASFWYLFHNQHYILQL